MSCPIPRPPPTPEAEAPAPETESKDWKAEAEKWQHLSRETERKAKANAKELETLKQASMNDLERAVAQAKAEARTEALLEVGAERAADAIRLAATGRMEAEQVEGLLEGLDLTKFLDDNGQPDRQAIAKWVDRVAPALEDEPAPSGFPDLGQGARGGPKPHALNGDPLLRDLKNKLGIR